MKTSLAPRDQIRCTLRLAKADGQFRQATQSQIRPPDEWSGIEAPIGQAPQHQLKGYLTFNPRQRCSKAEMCRPAECKMPVVGTGDVQAIGIRKSLRISIPGCHYSDYSLALSNPFSAENRIF